ncbi:hypothetical protein RclHR1_03710001 [Rhizophagus clarus]|uniref:BACK domain-containing protein n=1 Tax=Rhizophagus clarus TaxID=94130 RepID=A0A2Z6S6X1_9GLOM|nr:hypothetical protein RclHR1_03710001 [Rhizophagus clarus]
MNILCYRSPYLRRILTSNKKNKGNDLVHIKLPNILPEIFQIILDFSRCKRALSSRTSRLFTKIFIIQNFGFTQQISSKFNNLVKLQEFCINLMVQSPEKILSSFNFTSLSEKSLISLIKRDGLQMKEVEVWEHVLKWGLAQNPNLIPDPITWSDDDFKKMENTLQHCLPLIRFFSLPSKEFLQSVRPYQKLLNRQLYEDIINSYMDPDSKPDENKIERIIDSKIVTNLSIVKTISRQLIKWISIILHI